MKKIRIASLLVVLGLSVSCTTSYDAFGNPKQTVSPGVALAGVAAAGIAAYAISNNQNDNRHYRHYRQNVRYNNFNRGGFTTCYY